MSHAQGTPNTQQQHLNTVIEEVRSWFRQLRQQSEALAHEADNITEQKRAFETEWNELLYATFQFQQQLSAKEDAEWYANYTTSLWHNKCNLAQQEISDYNMSG